MLNSLKRGARRAGAGLVLTALAAVPLPTLAQEDPAAHGGDRQTVVRDATSGAFRPATPEEARSLGRIRVSPRAASAPVLNRFHPSGARGARLNDSFMSYSVLVRQPDGSLLNQCFQSREEADAALNAAPATRPQALPTE